MTIYMCVCVSTRFSFAFAFEFYRSWNLVGDEYKFEICWLVSREFGNCIIQGIFRKLKQYTYVVSSFGVA